MTIAKMPLAKDIDDFVFDGSPINETLVRDLAGGNFLEHQRYYVLVGVTGTGKTHLAIAIARACIRDGARGRLCGLRELRSRSCSLNVVDLVNKLEAEARADRQGTEILACNQAGITVTLPKPSTSSAKAEGRFGKQDFRYVTDEDVYICPADNRLTYRFTYKEAGLRVRR